ncbi:prostaglandin F2 receptor negative regulator [Betta splendens]|uniref:Prostaglandin F2 receptor negative regulator n=1 Tax=Betta splendens TaxID=158456 RepID=A0A6P7LUH9_BETSP|nr:prostaglandin F2 receptor negative regulator [Betta splendens]
MGKCLLSVVFGLLLLGGCCWARVVNVPPGPLIRVEGQPVSIICDVIEYSGPNEQDFDWLISPTAKGETKIKIISTFDARYSDSSYTKRVASGDISVVRLGDNVVELKIAELKAQDAGFYWCLTPSTDYVIKGNYDDKVQLIVIPNTLQVSPQTPPANLPEGNDLTLSCNVTRRLTLSTYLSVAWSVKSGAASEDILTFGPEGDVTTGAKFARRYADGGLRLVPGRNGLFELVISRVMTSDGGTYTCSGTEWSHEDDNWIKIVESTKEIGTVKVIPTGQSLSVNASSSSSSSSTSLLLSPGGSLALLCSVSADNLPALSLEVTWLANDRDVITVDRSGVVISNTSSSSAPGNTRGQASVERTGPGEYRLGVRGLSGEDAGDYTCRVRAFIDKGGRSSGGGGRWHMAAEKKSSPVVVKVSEIKPNFTLSLEVVQNPQMTADPTELSCNVINISHLPIGGRLGVTWVHTSLPGDDPQTSQPVASLDGDGDLQPGPLYADRLKSAGISLSRVQPNTFKLQIPRTQEADMGQYACVVSAWSLSSRGDMVKTVEYKSPQLTVRWNTKTPSLNVVAKRIREASAGGSTFEMSCNVSSQNLGEAGYNVLIQSQENLGSNVKTIMSLSPDNIVQHGGATQPNRRDNLVLTKSGPSEFRFRLAGVQLTDRGFYWCDVTALTKPQPGQAWTRATSAESNKVRIDFQENGPSFTIAIRSDDTSVYPSKTTKMECSLSVSGSSPKTDDLAYEVLWFFTRLRGGQTTTQVASVDRSGVVKTELRNSSSEVSIVRTDTHTYIMNIFGTQDSDSGEYYCVATPWYLSASTGAWTQAEKLTSTRVFLTVQFAVWDSLKLPLLYGASASIGVGVFSLVLGLICAQCCCRNTSHLPRSRSKLSDMEMD